MKRLKGIAASPGIALGPAFVYRPVDLTVRRRQADDQAEEWKRYQEAASSARAELEALGRKAAAEMGETEAAIFTAHQMIIGDPEIETELQAELSAGASVEAAVETVFGREVETFSAMDDPLFRERAADFADVARRLLRLLLDIEDNAFEGLDAPAIVVAQDLLPSDTAQMDKAMVRGFCTAGGGPLSHTAILARNLGLPAVVGLGEDILDFEDGEWLVVDGTEGFVIAEIDEEQRATYEQRVQAMAVVRSAAQASAHEDAITRDGHRVEVVANIGLPGEEVQALEAGAEGIGLLRTEFLFVGRERAPSEEEQFRAYRSIFERMGPRPVIARTLDIGGDKPVAFLPVSHEDNPYLGWRAIRIGLARPELLKTQVRALLRAGAGYNLKIMFPMIATVEEMQRAAKLVDEGRVELLETKQPCADGVEIGTMIEVPSAALITDHLAEHVDFFSIGSNDLTQYTLAADRGNPSVAPIFDSLHPAVLRLVDTVIREAHDAGLWVGMCGELAGEPVAIPVLLGLGLDEFSMGSAAIPGGKALIRQLSMSETRSLAREALAQPSAAAVRALVKKWMADRDLGSWPGLGSLAD